MKNPRKPIAPICRRNLLLLARCYAAETGVQLGAVARQCYGDSRIFDKLAAKEGSVTLPKYDAMVDWFFANWPAHPRRQVLPRLERLDQAASPRKQNGRAAPAGGRADANQPAREV